MMCAKIAAINTNDPHYVKGIFCLLNDICKSDEIGELHKEAYSILHSAAECLRKNGYVEYSLEILKNEEKTRVDKFIDLKLEHAYLYVLALLESSELEKQKEAFSIIEYYSERPYLFPDISRIGQFLYIRCCMLIHYESAYKKLPYFFEILAKTSAGIKNNYLLRVIHHLNGLKYILKNVQHINFSTFISINIIWNAQKLSSMGIIPGIIGRGLHLLLVIWRKYKQSLGSNQLWMLQSKITPESKNNSKSILVTRAMGGIGDLLMMTPALRCLYFKYNKKKIHFAIPKQYHYLFEGNPYILLKDIYDDFFDKNDYSALYNLTQCPASIVETHSLPNVKMNRIEIFAKAMGLSKKDIRKMDKKPFYKLKKDEIEWAKTFFEKYNLTGRECIAIQPFAEDSYRNYSKIELLAKELARNNFVFVFHNKEFDGFEDANIMKVTTFPLRKSIALLSRCKKLYAIDSSFVHIAAALDIPTEALFGPINGVLRTHSYPLCHISTKARSRFSCSPCWRNTDIVCGRSLNSRSACLNEEPEEYIS